MRVIKPAEAIQEGQKRYFTGRPCKHGHLSERLVSTRACTACNTELERKRRNSPAPTRPPPAACEVCGKPPRRRTLHLDHDHKTGKFRGWLCNACNLGLGALGDNAEGLRAALRYLHRAEVGS